MELRDSQQQGVCCCSKVDEEEGNGYALAPQRTTYTETMEGVRLQKYRRKGELFKVAPWVVF